MELLASQYKAVCTWLTDPFTTQAPMWKLILTFVLFVIIGFLVVDNLDLLKKGLQV